MEYTRWPLTPALSRGERETRRRPVGEVSSIPPSALYVPFFSFENYSFAPMQTRASFIGAGPGGADKRSTSGRDDFMTGQTYNVPETVAPLLGDPHPLLLQIGLTGADTALSPAASPFQNRGVNSLPALRSFLECYRAELLFPVEFPAILHAHSHVVRNELRELMAVDMALAREPKVREFAAASCRVGQRQLNRLRSLRDQRLIQRYRAAIERGEAHGWHTLVYGLSLAVFALPLRQGLVAYASHTLDGFIQSAAESLALTSAQCHDLQATASAPVPEAVQQLLAAAGAAQLRLL
jgi:urease accessory protein UreF